jgi:hypothetical protein
MDNSDKRRSIYIWGSNNEELFDHDRMLDRKQSIPNLRKVKIVKTQDGADTLKPFAAHSFF